jgi:hypothetical protein
VRDFALQNSRKKEGAKYMLPQILTSAQRGAQEEKMVRGMMSPASLGVRNFYGLKAAPKATLRLARFTNIWCKLTAHKTVSNLRTAVERNDFHAEPSVFHHTQNVVGQIIGLLKLDFLSDPIIKRRLSTWLATKADPQGQYTRSELLVAASTLHDIGKGMQNEKGEPVIQPKKNDPSKTTAFKHAPVGASAARQAALESLNCTQKEADFIENIVAKHMDLFNLQASIEKEQSDAQDIKASGRREKGQRKKGGSVEEQVEKLILGGLNKIDYNPALILHTMADIMSCTDKSLEDVSAHVDLIPRVFTLKRIPIQNVVEMEKIAQSNGQIFVAGAGKEAAFEALAPIVENLIREEGRVPEDKISFAIPGRIKKLGHILVDRKGETAALIESSHLDAVLTQNSPGRPPAILELNLSEPPLIVKA